MSRQRALHDSEPRVAHLLQEKILGASVFVPQIPEVLAELVLEFCKLCGEGVRSPNVVGQRKNLVGNPRPLRYSRGVRVRRSCRNTEELHLVVRVNESMPHLDTHPNPHLDKQDVAKYTYGRSGAVHGRDKR